MEPKLGPQAGARLPLLLKELSETTSRDKALEKLGPETRELLTNVFTGVFGYGSVDEASFGFSSGMSVVLWDGERSLDLKIGDPGERDRFKNLKPLQKLPENGPRPIPKENIAFSRSAPTKLRLTRVRGVTQRGDYERVWTEVTQQIREDSEKFWASVNKLETEVLSRLGDPALAALKARIEQGAAATSLPEPFSSMLESRITEDFERYGFKSLQEAEKFRANAKVASRKTTLTIMGSTGPTSTIGYEIIAH